MSKVEEVAGAMCNAAHDGGDGAARDWNSNQGIYRSMARAAIEAMREPSVAMQQVVSAQWGRSTWAQYDEVIEAALKEINP